MKDSELRLLKWTKILTPWTLINSWVLRSLKEASFKASNNERIEFENGNNNFATW